MNTTVTDYLLARKTAPDASFEAVMPLVYDELRRLASGQLRRNPAATLDTTALVHEAYLKLADQTRLDWTDRAHFAAIAAQAMRYVLVDRARRRMADKRGGGARPIRIDATGATDLAAEERAADLLALDEALSQLTVMDARLGAVVELRFFGGLTVEETAEALDLSPMTVKRAWKQARLWLYRAIQTDA